MVLPQQLPLFTLWWHHSTNHSRRTQPLLTTQNRLTWKLSQKKWLILKLKNWMKTGSPPSRSRHSRLSPAGSTLLCKKQIKNEKKMWIKTSLCSASRGKRRPQPRKRTSRRSRASAGTWRTSCPPGNKRAMGWCVLRRVGGLEEEVPRSGRHQGEVHVSDVRAVDSDGDGVDGCRPGEGARLAKEGARARKTVTFYQGTSLRQQLPIAWRFALLD